MLEILHAHDVDYILVGGRSRRSPGRLAIAAAFTRGYAAIRCPAVVRSLISERTTGGDATVSAMARPVSLLRTVEVRVLEQEKRLFRICGRHDGEAFLDAFRSHYELGRPPRGPEHRAAVIHMALSMFDRSDIARDMAERVPKLGGHVAVMDLCAGLGICLAKTGGPTHWSI